VKSQIDAKNLSFKYYNSNDHILNGIDINVKKGEIISVVGLSGSGKTTLSYCLSGIIPHVYEGELTGNVFIKGENIKDLSMPNIATKVGIVFQNPETQLFFPIVENELAFGPENLCIDSSEIGKRIKNVLKLLNIDDLRYERIEHLSGGQKQMVALASVLTLEPDILIFDEVMSQIDTEGKKAIKNIISNLKNEGKSIIMVEHNLYNIDIADRKLLLKDGRLTQFEGRLL